MKVSTAGAASEARKSPENGRVVGSSKLVWKKVTRMQRKLSMGPTPT